MFVLPILKYKTNAEGKLVAPSSYKNISADKRCSVSRCPNKHYAKKYCLKHYQRFSKYGDPLKLLRAEENQKCKVDKCYEKAKVHLLCNKHYQRQRKHGKLEIDNPRFTWYDSICSVKDCHKKHYCHGYCSSHYYRFNKYGDPLYSKRKVIMCTAINCNRKQKAKSLCDKHYQRRKARLRNEAKEN
jgi:hypothetical protein